MIFPIRRSHAFRAVILLACVFLFATAALAQTDPRIVGGQEADPGEWPWQVALVQAGASPGSGQFCGGSLIGSDWVLTAAHCVYTSDINDLDVVAGIHDLVTPEPGIRRVALAEIIVHNGWNNSTKDNDIALLRLAEPILERPTGGTELPIQYAILPQPSVGDLTGVTTTVTGWGNRDPNGQDFPARLHEVEVSVISNAECSQAYNTLTDNMLCAGVPGGGKDSCQGDSGGPLVYQDVISGEWRQVGIVSFGIGCAEAEHPGVYARVSRYLNWIQDIVSPMVPTDFAYVPVILDVPAAPPPPPPSPLVNGDFEQGPGVGWSESSSGGWPIVVDNFAGNDVQPNGGWAAWLGGAHDEESRLWQQIVISAATPVLRYSYAIYSEDICLAFDTGQIIINGTNVVKDFNLCAVWATDGWVQETIDLSSYAGQSVELLFVVETDSSEFSNLFIDDVSFVAARSAAEPVGPRTPSNLVAPKSK